MLVTKPKYTAGDIITIKIVNGDEIVAKYVSNDDKGFIVTKPMTVIPSQNGFTLVPSLFTVEPGPDMPVEFQHVMLHGPTTEKMVDYYVERTSPIQQIKRGSIIV